MRRPPLKSPGSYERLVLAIRDTIDEGGDIPCMRPDSDPEWWFSDEEREVNRARERCRVCPVQVLCRAHAIRQNEHGIWAAESRTERNLTLSCTVVVVAGP